MYNALAPNTPLGTPPGTVAMMNPAFTFGPNQTNALSSSDAFLEAANAIGLRLCRDALWDGDRCNWLGVMREPHGGAWVDVERALGPDFYGGTSGIAFFLVRLYALTRDKLFLTTAQGALRQALSVRQRQPVPSWIGFYSGLTGIAYALSVLGDVTGDGHITENAVELCREVCRTDLTQAAYDVISGVAGAITPLLYFARRYDLKEAEETAVRYGEHLLQVAQKSEAGWSWPDPGTAGPNSDFTNTQNLTGFSHGAAGIAWSLLELHYSSKNEAFKSAAEQGFRYERSVYNALGENWPDFRKLSADASGVPAYPVLWCHGAPGIGFSRLRAYQLTGDPTYRAEAEAALRTTGKMLLQSGMGNENYSLCHGVAGNADLFLYAGKILRDDSLIQFARSCGQTGMERYERTRLGWPNGISGLNGHNPSLMLGTAGTGHFLLQLHAPDKIPSILLVPGSERNESTD